MTNTHLKNLAENASYSVIYCTNPSSVWNEWGQEKLDNGFCRKWKRKKNGQNLMCSSWCPTWPQIKAIKWSKNCFYHIKNKSQPVLSLYNLNWWKKLNWLSFKDVWNLDTEMHEYWTHQLQQFSVLITLDGEIWTENHGAQWKTITNNWESIIYA